jgi:hypothetical protein
VVGLTISLRGEVPGKRKHVIREKHDDNDDDDDDNNNNNNNNNNKVHPIPLSLNVIGYYLYHRIF